MLSIADYVADLRAPTPSAAAELAVFDYRQFENRLEVLREALNRGVERNLERKKDQGGAVSDEIKAASSGADLK